MDLILILTIIFLFTILFMWYKHKNVLIDNKWLPYKYIPGPLSLPLLGTTYLTFNKDMPTMFEYNTHIFQKYYPGPVKTSYGLIPSLEIFKAEHIEVIARSSANITKAKFYYFLQSWLGSGLLTSTASKWFGRRKMITPAFHFKILDIFTDIFIEKANLLIDILKQNSTDSIDIRPFITNCTLDIICESAMGVQINAQQHTDNEYVQAIHSISIKIVERIFSPWLFSNWLWSFSENGRETQRCLKILHQFTDQVINERRKIYEQNPNLYKNLTELNDIGEKKRLAFLDVLLNSKIDGISLTNEEIREEVDTFMFEGHDTTTTAICWALYMLGNHLDIQYKVQKEIDLILIGSKRSFTKQDIPNMKYLECVIKETLRLYPSVPVFSRSLETDLVIDKYLIPKGVQASLNVYLLHRDPEQFPEPNKFDPDRFLPENCVKRHPYAYCPFSAGPRNCIGQKFAMIEEKIILATILRHFHIICHTKPDDFHPMCPLILKPSVLIPVTLKLRDTQKIMN